MTLSRTIGRMLRFIWSELRKPYGYAGMIWALAGLLFLGGALWQLGTWLSSLPAAWGWV